MGERGLFRGHVRFADSVDLYVGHEDDLIMRNWPHALEVPHPKAKVFTPIETIPNSEQLDVGDDVSFVAAHVHRQQNFPVQQHQEPEIMNDPEIVIDDNHIDDVHAESESDSESLTMKDCITALLLNSTSRLVISATCTTLPHDHKT